MELAFAAMMGACGTLWPGWWRGPHPHPDPEPWWRIVEMVIGAVGGIGAWVVLGPKLGADSGIVGMSLIGFFGGVFLGGLAAGVGVGAKRGTLAAAE